MKIGFTTICLGGLSLKEKALWAKNNGFGALEIACWPGNDNGSYSGADIDVDALSKKQAGEITALMNEYGLTISSLAYYDNNLDADPDRRAFVNSHVKKVIDAAALLGTPLVGTFVGKDSSRSFRENFDEFEKVFGALAAHAEDNGVKLMIENCDMRGWQTPWEPGTISYSPELWQEMFARVPSKSFGLNYDPSHLLLMLMDYIAPVAEFRDRIFHAHAKDSRVLKKELNRYGVFDRRLGEPNQSGYREAKIPGLGDIDWKAFIGALQQAGYDSVLSIEHEDKAFEGSVEKVKEGLLIAKQNLETALASGNSLAP
ncbi:MAG: sugar phosphate isomerase/epimerase [Kiritimatiellales bacterium]|jgi:sugar phosphate isomerase/epimerase